MKLSIAISREEIESGVALSTEAQTIKFYKYFGAVSKLDKAKLILGMDIVKHLEMRGVQGYTLDFVMNKKYGIRLEMEADLVDAHDTLRRLYQDPKKLEGIIIKALISKKPQLEELRDNVASLIDMVDASC